MSGYEGIDLEDFSLLGPTYMDKIRQIIRDELGLYLSSFISDSHREFFVRAHAQGISTSDAATELMMSDDTMNRLAHEDAMGMQGLRNALIPRVAYLKPGSARWPGEEVRRGVARSTGGAQANGERHSVNL